MRQDGGTICIPKTKPGGEGRAVLVDCHHWYRASPRTAVFIRIVRAGRCQHGEHRAVGAGDAVEVAAAHGTAHDDVVRAPGMARAQIAVGHEGAGEIGEGKRHDL